MKTHRCEELLTRNKENFDRVRIRYWFRYNSSLPNEVEKRWYLDEIEEDYDWDTTFTIPVCEIKYCPFCGEELNNEKER